MSVVLSSKQVWGELENNLFAVLGMVTTKGEARTVGIVYVVHMQRNILHPGMIPGRCDIFERMRMFP
jgi:hypothetical protein